MSKSVTTEQMRAEQKRQKREAEYGAAVKKLPTFTRVAAGVMLAVLLLFFMTWAEIYNTDIVGPEVSFNGWAATAAGVTRDFMSAGAIYQDMAVPFYYYASGWVENIATLTLIALIAAALGCALQVLAIVKPGKLFNFCGAALEAVAGVLLIVVFITAVSMKGSDILPYYCQGNPACSIRSYAILPALLALCAAGLSGWVASKYVQAEKRYK